MRIAALFFLFAILVGCNAAPAPVSELPTAPAVNPVPPTLLVQAAPTAVVTLVPSPLPPASPTAVVTAPTPQPLDNQPVSVTPTAPPVNDQPVSVTLQEFAAPRGSHPHDVAPAADGGIWYTAQQQGALGYLDVRTGKTRQIPLGRGSAPHGVILGPDSAPWITDGGLNAIVRVDPANDKVDVYPLPATHPGANLNTAVFDKNGVLWFTGQRGVYGRLDPKVGQVETWDAPRGVGPYGITTTPNGDVYYASLAGNHIARIDPQTGTATVLEPPTPGQGARRVWSDSQGRVWVSEWNAGQVGVFDPASNSWKEWKLPAASASTHPQAYAVFVDENDQVWLSDFGSNALVRFDPATETFDTYPLPSAGAAVRQLHGRAGEVWGAESGADKIIVVRTQ